MNIHKRTRLTLLDRQEIWRLYQTRSWKVTHLAERFLVSRPTVYNVARSKLKCNIFRREMLHGKIPAIKHRRT